MKVYYRVTSMEQLQKVYNIVNPRPSCMLYRYINKAYRYEEVRDSFKACLRDYGQLFFDGDGAASCTLYWECSKYTVIDVGAEDRYNL